MHIDFHYAGTYVCARLAGFDHADAKVVAYAAQYVDDAVHSGIVEFGAMGRYSRLSSAHKTLDYQNFLSLSQARVWIPFHFVPGNGGLPAGQGVAGGRSEALVVVPDSLPAQDMVRECIAARHKPWALQRLGITMHAYADTWSHQGFSGISDSRNAVSDIRLHNATLGLKDRMSSWFVGTTLPLGHGAVLSCPDRPFLRWSYVNGAGERVERDNPADYEAAAHGMVKAMRRWRLGDPDAVVEGVGHADLEALRVMIGMEEEWDQRLGAWYRAIGAGAFSFGPAEIAYIESGPGSWKFDALGTNEDRDVYDFAPSFAESAWKRFHDALQEHRFDVLHSVLPRYGLLED